MSVADTIQELATDIGNAYDEVQSKSGIIPQNKNTNNLATAIRSIPTGITPTGQIAITQNGTYDVTDYASASVDVPNWLYNAKALSNSFSSSYNNTDIDLGLPQEMNLGYLSNCRSIDGIFSCYLGYDLVVRTPKKVTMELNSAYTVDSSRAFYRRHCIEEISFINGIKMSGYNMFVDCTNLKKIKGEIDGTSVKSFIGASFGAINAFQNCSKLEEIEFKAETILISIDFHYSPLLTQTSIQSIIDGLATVTTARTITFSSSLINPLTSQQEQEIADKGWSLAYA